MADERGLIENIESEQQYKRHQNGAARNAIRSGQPPGYALMPVADSIYQYGVRFFIANPNSDNTDIDFASQ
jgi:hypothetical protein